MTTHLSPFSQNKKSTNVRTFDMIGQKVNTWLERRRDRRRLASMDARALRDLGIDPAQAEFEAARKPWQEETGLGKDIEIGIDCPPRGDWPVDSAAPSAGMPETIRIAGLPIGLRPVLPEDKESLRDFWNGLSERSRQLRFLSVKHRFSELELNRMSRVDQRNHVAWVAVDLTSPQERILGEVRFVKTASKPGMAEFGVTVGDWVQGRGLGRKLMEILAVEARRCGVSTLRGYVSEGNALMLGYVMHRGGKVALDYPGVMQVDLPVSAVAKTVMAAAE